VLLQTLVLSLCALVLLQRGFEGLVLLLQLVELLGTIVDLLLLSLNLGAQHRYLVLQVVDLIVSLVVEDLDAGQLLVALLPLLNVVVASNELAR
jgi:hypothetical protein